MIYSVEKQPTLIAAWLFCLLRTLVLWRTLRGRLKAALGKILTSYAGGLMRFLKVTAV